MPRLVKFHSTVAGYRAGDVVDLDADGVNVERVQSAIDAGRAVPVEAATEEAAPEAAGEAEDDDGGAAPAKKRRGA